MPAYPEIYLMSAMENLGEMADSAISLFGVSLSVFWPSFVATDVAREVESGSPFAIVGKSGLELAIDACVQAGLIEYSEAIDIARRDMQSGANNDQLMSLSRAYWCGWSLAHYQWRCGRTFAEIERTLPIDSVEKMYRTFHEESEDRFCEAADEIIASAKEPCGLKRQRELLGLSQSQLARRSGVGLRAIQQYEQGAKDIAKASYLNIDRLSKVLHCEPRLLMDGSPSYYS